MPFIYVDRDLLIGDGASPKVRCLSKSVFASRRDVVWMINQLWCSSRDCIHSCALLLTSPSPRRRPRAALRPCSFPASKVLFQAATTILISSCALVLMTPKFNLPQLLFPSICNSFCSNSPLQMHREGR